MPVLDWLGLSHLPQVPAEMVTTCLQAKALDRGPRSGHTELNTAGGDANFGLRFPFDPSEGFFYPGNNYNVYVDGENLGAWHNGWILSDGFGFNAFPREQGNVGLTQFVGANHELKYGIDYQDTKWEGENARTSFMNGWGYDSYNPFGVRRRRRPGRRQLLPDPQCRHGPRQSSLVGPHHPRSRLRLRRLQLAPG